MTTSRRSVGVYQPRSRRAAMSEAIAAFRDYVAYLIREAIHRGFGLVLMFCAVCLLAALASYDSADPSFDNATARETANWLGGFGAHLADLLLRLLGVAALAVA